MGPIERELREWAEHSPTSLPVSWPFGSDVEPETVSVCIGAYISLGFGPELAMKKEDARDVLSEAIEAASELGL